MQNKFRLIVFTTILVIGILIAYYMNLKNRTLPIYSPAMLNPELVDASKRDVKSKHRIDAFSLIDENNNIFDNNMLEGKYYVADFFFTTCPSICIDMSAQLKRVQHAYKNSTDFLIVSHTVQPEIDSAKVLKEYALLHDAIPGKWVFLTGNKKTIYDLARKSYFAATSSGDGGVNDFIHTENFVLVDKQKRIRGFYDGTSTEEVDKLIGDIEILEQEYN